MSDYLLVTGMSGAGRSTAAAVLEDLGWFVIDNLPPRLISKVIELASPPGSEYEHICLVVGRGGSESLAELSPAIATLRASGARVRLLFLDASDEVLVRRFEGTRRRHPLEADGVLGAIAQERELLGVLKESADVVVDTGELNVHQLRDRLVELFVPTSGAESLAVSVVSFGFKYGPPLDADLMFDCRFLPNPHWVEALRGHTGLDREVRDYVLANPEAKELVEKLDELLGFLLPAYSREGKSYLSIGVGCTGGRHRSVVIAEELAARVAERGYTPTVHHRDLDR